MSNPGTIVGVALGVAGFVALVAALAGWLLYKRRAKQRMEEDKHDVGSTASSRRRVSEGAVFRHVCVV
jgi:LPXTG-motif cell wall-anchored protein